MGSCCRFRSGHARIVVALALLIMHFRTGVGAAPSDRIDRRGDASPLRIRSGQPSSGNATTPQMISLAAPPRLSPPSAAVASRLAAMPVGPLRLDLVIAASGDHAPDGLDLAVLHGLKQEAQALHRLAPQARILSGSDADPDNVLGAMAGARVVHLPPMDGPDPTSSRAASAWRVERWARRCCRPRGFMRDQRCWTHRWSCYRLARQRGTPRAEGGYRHGGDSTARFSPVGCALPWLAFPQQSSLPLSCICLGSPRAPERRMVVARPPRAPKRSASQCCSPSTPRSAARGRATSLRQPHLSPT
jgi:hypothetical protein